METKNFKKEQEIKQTALIGNKKESLFEGAQGGGRFMGKNRAFVLRDGKKNLHKNIRKSAIDYFKANDIAWWRGKGPSGHILSSQIACINHLFSIKNDKKAVLAVAKAINKDFKDVLPIPYDKGGDKGYIGFEVVSNKDYLNEGTSTRGTNCTSIDAFIYAVDKAGKKWLIPIEWKYTEYYNNGDKSKEDRRGEAKGTNGKGKERMCRYNDLITKSEQLKSLKEYQGTIYYQEPFYQLMRQTLWAEQVIKNNDIEAHDYLHIHVIPKENKTLLNKIYRVSGKDMETTWREMLTDKGKERYILIDPEELLAPIADEKKFPKYADLITYLKKRYWD